MGYCAYMTNDPEILAELVKTNEILDQVRRYARFADQVLKIRILLGAIFIASAFVIAGILLFQQN
jgi:hypothetical protein